MFDELVSVRNKTWSYLESDFFKEYGGIDARVLKMVHNRGIEDFDSYFSPSFKKSMPDPNVLFDMNDSVCLIADSIINKKRLVLIGDYDVDGATSTSILVKFFEMIGFENFFWKIPHRIDDGYGASVDFVSTLISEDPDIDIFIILDSGTTSFDAIDFIVEAGKSAVVLDHHEPHHGKLPKCLVVNPKRFDCDRSHSYLCTAGLSFLFVVGLQRELRSRGYFNEEISIPNIKTLLGLVALGTVADVVPLVGLNRDYVSLGLRYLGENDGIRHLCEVTKESRFDVYTCGFVFGPCLNAAGRLEDMNMGVELLTSRDESRLKFLASHLFALNVERKKVQNQALEKAKAIVETSGYDDGLPIVLYDDDWHPGIVGLVAARIREFYDVPSIVIGSGGKGSCRSVDGFDIGQCIISANEKKLILKGGGHSAAAGLTADLSCISEFRDYVRSSFLDFEHPSVLVDASFEIGMVGVDFIDSYMKMSPFGMSNPKPLVVMKNCFVRAVQILKGLHVKLYLDGENGEMDAMAFNVIGTKFGDHLLHSESKLVHIMGHLDVSQYNGVQKLYLKPIDFIVL